MTSGTSTTSTAPTDSTAAAAAEGSRRTPLFHGWKVAGAGGVILALQSAFILQAFGSYAVILEERFGWSKTTMSVAYSFNRAESGLLGPIQGWALHRFGSRRVMRLGAITVVIGFLLFSQVQNEVQFVASFFVIAVGAGLCGFMTITTETVRWFERARSRALSVTSLGMAIGGLTAPLIVVALRQLGWRQTAAGSGVVLGVVVFALASLYGSSPAAHGTHVDGIDPAVAPIGRPAGVSAHHYSAPEALRTRAFWFLAFGHASALLVVGSVIAHLSLYLTEEQRFSLQGASIVAAVIPIAQLAGMLLGGVLGDRMNKRILCAAAMLSHMVGLLLLTFATHRPMIWAFVAFHGIAWGMRGPMMSAIRADYFGSSSFGQIMGYTSLILMVGMVGGPLFAGVLADLTGNYQIGFTILALLAGAGSLLFLFATPPTPPTPPTPRPAATPTPMDAAT